MEASAQCRSSNTSSTGAGGRELGQQAQDRAEHLLAGHAGRRPRRLAAVPSGSAGQRAGGEGARRRSADAWAPLASALVRLALGIWLCRVSG